jgi:hypothetical protein
MASVQHDGDNAPEPGPLCRCASPDLRNRGYVRLGVNHGLDCSQPLLMVCSNCFGVAYWTCKSHRESRCVACSWRYRRLLSRIAEAGSRSTGFMYLLTLTAPGVAQHVMPSGDVCPCTPDGGVDLGEWNASAAASWNLMRTRLRALNPRLEYLRAVEVQKRGALHLHVIVWCPDPLDKVALREMAIRYGFGHSLDLAAIVPGSRRHAYYVAKYVTKACDVRETVPWASDLVHPGTGEITRVDGMATYRTWSASHGWGLTMKQCRTACRPNRVSPADVLEPAVVYGDGAEVDRPPVLVPI